MAISSNGTVLARLAGGLYNSTLSNSTYNEIVATVKTAADVNTFANDLYARDFASKTDLAVATTLVSNLGLSSVAGLNNWVSAQLTAAGAANKGAKIVSLLNDFANLTSDATYGSYATTFNTKTDAALALAQTTASKGGDFNAAATLAAAQAAQAAADAAAKAAADAAAKAAADKAAADAAVVPKSLALTTDIDSVVGGDGADTITAVSAAIQAGDIVKGGAGNDILSWTANGAAGAVEMSGVETVNARLLTSSSLDLTLSSGVNTVSVGSNSVAATTLTATGADFATAFEMKPGAKTIGLNVTYLDASGTADTAKVTLGGLGTSSSTTGGDAAVTINGAVEGVALTTSGTNYVDLTGTTTTKTITVTGTGNNYIDVITSATSTTVDASANTGKLDLDMASGLSAGDVIKAGSGTTDIVRAVIASTAALTPTISGVETLALTTTAAANVDFKNITGVTAVTLAETSVAERLSNVPSTVTSVSLQEDATSANNVRIDYVAKAAATLAANFAASALATTDVSYGDLTLSNVADVTLSASGSYAVAIGDVALGTAATALTVKTTAADGDFTTGDLTGKSIESITISATNGDVTIGDVLNEDSSGNTGTVKSLSITAAGGAAVTTNSFDFYAATSGVADGENDTALKSISISAGADSVITIGDITAADDNDNTDEGSAVSITASFGDNTDGSVVGNIAVVAASNVSITLENNAGEVAFGYVEAIAGDIDMVTLSVGSDASLLLDGGFWAYAGDVDGTNADGNIGDVSITVGQGGSIDSGANFDPEVWAEGSVGNVTISAERNASIYFLDITSDDDSIGDVTVTVARGGDVAIDDVIADADLGNVSITTTDSGVYTGDFTATNGDIGNITLVSGTSGEINSSFTAGASIGDVSITSKASDDITLDAADSLGNVTASVTAGDLLTLDITATDASNITVTGAGDLDLTVTADTAGNITVTSSNTNADIDLSVDLSGVVIAGVVSVTGGAGDDTILGAPTANTLNGGTGADSIVGGAAADTISAGTGNDTVTGGLGGDAINVSTGTDTVIYGTMTASSNIAKASALSGTITISSAFDILTGMGNGDIIDVSASENTDDTVSTSLLTSSATTGSAAIVRGKYDTTAGTWVAGTTDSTYNDYIVQWSDGTKITTILAVDIVGTVTMTDLLGVYTLSVV